jgi:hypothetical protein
MRAILPIATSDERLPTRLGDLEDILKKNHWLVVDLQRIDEIRLTVLGEVSEVDRDRVARQHSFSLEKANHTVTGILGVVPDDNRVEIRLIGATGSEIKATCSEMVEMFVRYDREAAKKHGVHFGFSFPHSVGIFSRTTKEQTWSGVVNPGGALRYAFKEERGQAWAFGIGILLFLGGLIITFPTLARFLFPRMDPQVFAWMDGYIGRAASAGLFGAIVAYLNIQLRSQELKRDGTIIWTHV